jgi:ABC-type lipoprotein export system ATPase subunit
VVLTHDEDLMSISDRTVAIEHGQVANRQVAT